jgi:hypothetical protein
MVEKLCAENNADFFGCDAHPIPQRSSRISSLRYAEELKNYDSGNKRVIHAANTSLPK